MFATLLILLALCHRLDLTFASAVNADDSVPSSNQTHRLSDPIQSITELSWDNTGHLAENYLLISSHAVCADLWAMTWSQRPDFAERTIVAATDAVLDHFAVSLGAATQYPDAAVPAASGSASRIACNAICIDRGTEHEKLKYVIPDKIMLASLADSNSESSHYGEVARRFQAWLEKVVMQCEIGFINWTPNEAEIFWIDERRQGEQVFTGEGEGEAIHEPAVRCVRV